MKTAGIIIAGVGGQGLVLATRMIAEAAFKAGMDVKTNDVVGLSQRGGSVWGTVKIGEKIDSPNILPGEGDILIGMEPLEALRWSGSMKEGGIIVLNENRVYPTPVLLEQAEYPEVQFEELKKRFTVISTDAREAAREAGNIKAANSVMLGILAGMIEMPEDAFIEVIKEHVPKSAVEENIAAFRKGIEISKAAL
ncbi:indolepyruvate oxidoreductase subunit beta [Youngiibacter multivorans]|uniref:Indolepyruvate ferredoxin oxidoreductase beta subunit n=1 Tax=Youngiibacter multivorans TaxID=937251 RepID=A0ABS4G5B2_9CLOT|nr:indolepyruvate oxidoreductase subunit beta [Youngiibacter multivorans]MBP1919747.1 indolepyruvate ferredoxin oxidoreductase beta subunit [Youngiibacter multivorans]